MANRAEIISAIDTVISGIMRDPVGAFMDALEPGSWPIRDIALQNGLLMPVEDLGNSKITWIEGATGATEVNLNVAIDADDTTTFDFGTTAIQGIVPNMIIAFGSEHVRVISVDYTAGTAVVSRGFDGTDALADIATSVTGAVLGVIPTDTEDAGSSTAAFGSELTNYLHYMEEVYTVSDRTLAALMQLKTAEASVAYQIKDKFKKMSRQLANALWRSKALSSGAYRMMNGFRAQVPAGNITAVNGNLLFRHVDNAVKESIDVGVIPDTMFVGGDIKVALAPWAPLRGTQIVQADPRIAGGSLMGFETAAGPILNVKVDTSLLSTDVFICRESDLHAGFIDALPQTVLQDPNLPQMVGVRVAPIAPGGAYYKAQCLAYATSQLTNAVGARLLSGVSGVDSDGV